MSRGAIRKAFWHPGPHLDSKRGFLRSKVPKNKNIRKCYSMLGPLVSNSSTSVHLLICFLVILLSARFLRENVAPQEGVGMQSDHACACFVRVGRCCLGSVLGSILSCFGRPQASIFVFLFGSVSKGNFWAAPRVPPEARDRD